jgi:hypothetical protein
MTIYRLLRVHIGSAVEQTKTEPVQYVCQWGKNRAVRQEKARFRSKKADFGADVMSPVPVWCKYSIRGGKIFTELRSPMRSL